MQLGHLVLIARPDQPDHVRLREAARRIGKPEIAVMRVGTQAVGLEILVAIMADGNALVRSR